MAYRVSAPRERSNKVHPLFSESRYVGLIIQIFHILYYYIQLYSPEFTLAENIDINTNKQNKG